ncbi:MULTISPECIES: class I SAM-dependent DNA methyltransferase [Thalassospira]|jgi:predicted TPR repeat methyltransferase|uniref:TPR repeat methyltransferase n=2 Tax=Thalassospira TaxID=168934 RepID=A0ABX0WUY6_9PROT|nr:MULTISPECIES: methyltransferase domain-containing protein [Thalassospira]AXO12935.1 methyltransferase domain-containing protein [Thalassospira indica]MBE71613.1 methyltransferase type 11 [Thalassospira sp.]MBO6577578.1 methyltransferase domain-containing protein [Thalassospira sp.]MBO6818037.1 methyltransferase domain-containing protein [Thalassospira sp.]MBO6842695.1 methyltransferase domain-containing protein [Thalassospira sp.]|tara:strand:- start:37 stop:1011 length:975 start_codon:yes stop_codon:yes gene_type:complete
MSKDRLSASRRLDVALALVSQGDYTAAIDVARAALAADSDWDEAHFTLGDIYERAGETENAVEAFRQYLMLDPKDRMGAEVRLTLLGAAALRDRLPPDYVRALFDDYAPRFEISLRDRLAYRGPELLFEAIRTHLPEMLRPMDVLDLGCGTGLVGEVFAGHVDAIDGIDLSPRMINRARAKGLYRTLVAGDITDMPADIGTDYSVVIAADVLNYLGDLVPALRAAHDRMKPGGLLVFTLEHGDNFPFDLGPGQRFRHHQRAISEWLVECGFNVLSDTLGVLRQEKGNPVEGRVIVARASDALALMAGDLIIPGDPDQASGQTLH